MYLFNHVQNIFLQQKPYKNFLKIAYFASGWQAFFQKL